MSDLNPQLVPPSANQNDYLIYLRQTNYRFADEFNSENPPPATLKELARKERNQRIFNNARIVAWITLTICAIVNYLQGVNFLFRFYLIPIVAYLVGKQREHESIYDPAIRSLRNPIPLSSYSESLGFCYLGLLTSFRLTISIPYDADTPELHRQIKTQLLKHWDHFVDTQTNYFRDRKLLPFDATWDPNEIECLLLPLFFPIAYQNKIQVFQFKIDVVLPERPPVRIPTSSKAVVTPAASRPRANPLQISGLVYCGDSDE